MKTLVTLLAAVFAALAAPSAATAAGEPLTGMEFVALEGGLFQMGDTLNEGLAAEQPAHAVRLSPFFIAAREVTVAQYRRFAEATDYRTEAERQGWVKDIDLAMGAVVRREGVSWRNPGFPLGEDFPAVWLTWRDAERFVRWMADETGLPYRLPTEAQWEYAARGGGRLLSWSGTSNHEALPEIAWYDANSGGHPRPVGKKRANSLGLHDMSGNVWEWCRDWRGSYRAGAEPLQDPEGGTGPAGLRAIRGGSWRVDENLLRATYRNGYREDYAHSSIGFRVVRLGKWE